MYFYCIVFTQNFCVRSLQTSPFVFFYLRLFFRIVTFQLVTADSSKNFSPARGNPLWLQNARASRPVIMFSAWVAELSAIEFFIAEIIAQASSLRKKMSHIREFHSPAAAASEPDLADDCNRSPLNLTFHISAFIESSKEWPCLEATPRKPPATPICWPP